MNEVTKLLYDSHYRVEIECQRRYGWSVCQCAFYVPEKDYYVTYDIRIQQAEELLRKRALTNWPGYYCYGNENVRIKFHGA